MASVDLGNAPADYLKGIRKMYQGVLNLAAFNKVITGFCTLGPLVFSIALLAYSSSSVANFFPKGNTGWRQAIGGAGLIVCLISWGALHFDHQNSLKFAAWVLSVSGHFLFVIAFFDWSFASEYCTFLDADGSRCSAANPTFSSSDLTRADAAAWLDIVSCPLWLITGAILNRRAERIFGEVEAATAAKAEAAAAAQYAAQAHAHHAAQAAAQAHGAHNAVEAVPAGYPGGPGSVPGGGGAGVGPNGKSFTLHVHA